MLTIRVSKFLWAEVFWVFLSEAGEPGDNLYRPLSLSLSPSLLSLSSLLPSSLIVLPLSVCVCVFFYSPVLSLCLSLSLLSPLLSVSVCDLSPPSQPLQIKSVVAPEHVKGYIYVESYKQTHVKAAIEGVGNLRMGFWNQQMVPIKEMTDVLKVVKEVTNLKPKSWVRLKRGLYKDDIAQVWY